MTIADLVFLVAALAVAASLVLTLVAAVRGQWSRVWRLARIVSIGVGLYVGAGAAVSYAAPQRVLAIGAPWCFDDWCLALGRITEHPGEPEVMFTAELRIFSRARGVSQRANGAWIYLIDARGTRYASESDPADVPLDVLLAPGEERVITRRFALPAGVRPVGLVTGHGGSYCGPMDLLVIGSAGCLFGKPTMVGLGEPRVGER